MAGGASGSANFSKGSSQGQQPPRHTAGMHAAGARLVHCSGGCARRGLSTQRLRAAAMAEGSRSATGIAAPEQQQEVFVKQSPNGVLSIALNRPKALNAAHVGEDLQHGHGSGAPAPAHENPRATLAQTHIHHYASHRHGGGHSQGCGGCPCPRPWQRRPAAAGAGSQGDRGRGQCQGLLLRRGRQGPEGGSAEAAL